MDLVQPPVNPGRVHGGILLRAVERFGHLKSELEDAGFDQERLLELVDGNEALEQLLAEVVRGTVESDLAAKRTLLARALTNALNDSATLDVEGRFVRVATEVDTVDIRVLALVEQIRRPREGVSGEFVPVTNDEIVTAWSGVGSAVSSITATLSSLGLILPNVTWDASIPNHWSVSDFGVEFLEHLRSAGLDEELERRASG